MMFFDVAGLHRKEKNRLQGVNLGSQMTLTRQNFKIKSLVRLNRAQVLKKKA